MKRIVFMGFLLFLGLSTAFGQIVRISGVVTDANTGDAVPFASVAIKGTADGTIAEIDGKYSLSAPRNATLVVSSIGYETQEFAIEGRSIINVVLQPDLATLQEVVVVGYGSTIKSKLTGNVAKVGGDDLEYAPVPSVQLALQGKAAGVFIESVTGKVTSASRVRIRGSSSLSASSEPLYVIDGIPFDMSARNIHGGAINPLASLNTNDIESVDILKDASAAAIYGSRGANGVIIITTKRGKAGVPKLSLNLQGGFSRPSNKRDFMNAQEFISYFRHAALNSRALDGNDPWYTNHVESRLKRYSGHAQVLDAQNNFVTSKVDTDWQELAFQDAQVRNVDFAASGGDKNLRYFASLGYSKQDGIMVANGLERFSGRVTIDSKLSDRADLGFSVGLSRTNLGQINADNAFANPMQIVALAPITPERDLNGILIDRPVATYYNPLRHVEYSDRKMDEVRSVNNAYLTLKLIKGLGLRNEVSYDSYTLKENNKYGTLTNAGEATQGYGFSSYAQTTSVLGRSYFDYNGKISQWSLSAVLGGEAQYTILDATFVEGNQFPLDDFKTLASAATITGGYQTVSEYSFASVFSRVNFDLNAKYLFTVSARFDGSSRFGSNNRWGFFPAAGAGWVLTQEDFLANHPFISFLKLRTSYGVTGNAGIGNYAWRGLYGVTSYAGLPGLTPTVMSNPNLGWETTMQVDVGVDFGFFRNRVSGEIDYYHKKTSDLLFNVPVPGTSGYTSMLQNIGTMENRGFEFVLNTNNLVGDFKWNTSLNFAYNQNKVTALDGDQEIIDSGGARFMNVVMVGQPIGVFYGAQYAGVNPANGDAIWYVNQKDANGNIINPEATTNNFNLANYVVLGNPNPPYIGAITNTFLYKGFELNFTFQGVAGNKIHLSGDSYMAANAEWYDNQLRSQLNSWRNPGDITMVPQARFAIANGIQGRNSRYVEDGSYLKLRSLTFAYNLPAKLVSDIGFKSVRVYMMGQNLLTFTKFTGWDPEVSSDFIVGNVTSGVDFYSPPQPRTITFGINLGF